MKRIATLISIIAAAVAVSAPVSQAGVSFAGGNAGVSVFCYQNFGGNTTRLWAANASDRELQFRIYIENRTYPQRSGWQNWRILPAREQGAWVSNWDYGALVGMGTGVIRVYVQYAMHNGVGWDMAGEWIPFQVPLGYTSTFCSA